MKDKNANHVLQKCLECIPCQKLHFIFDSVTKNSKSIMQNTYACRIVQKILAYAPVETAQAIIQSLLKPKLLQAFFLSNFSNHVVHYILMNELVAERRIVFDVVTKNFASFSKNKCGR